MRVLWLLLFAGSMAQQDMDRNVFLFSRKSLTNDVVLTPMATGPLRKLTVCLRSYTNEGKYALLTMGIENSQIRNMFVISHSTPGYFDIYINDLSLFNPGTRDVLEWNHICVTWDSDTGVLQLWVNGKLSPRTVLQKGSSIDLQGGISLGQMHIKASYWHHGRLRFNDIKWDPETSFKGEISDVHMWNEVLSPETIRRVLLNDREINGNVISWRSLNYTINGDVIVQPKIQCRYGSESGSSHSQCYIE
ncbi:C-reactive protein-like isoform X1 [Xenopus laevis]|uniref:Pentraxin family member n=2 Tax=Xenopus laevis TaxID=8355 RepID=A0A1L8F4E6_XENLA|nr:C-reactive protein-like isoform X1 [Xenopus laevis]OCT66456.1 hypothetical protein XELAEV_18042706mg [Xenopus laevis]